MARPSFAEIVNNYSVIFFDAFGVLKNSGGLLEGTPELLAWLNRSGKEVFILTNDSSRAPSELARIYEHPEHGSLVPASRTISSGLLAQDFLRNRVKSGKVAYLGTQESTFYIQAAGLEAIPVSECSFDHPPSALVLLDDEGFDWFADVNRAVNLIRRTNLPVVVANADRAYPINNHNDVAVAVGSLATMMESILGKRFIHFGKPDTMMFSYAFANAHANLPKLAKKDVLMVGDTLRTDIYGATAFGLDTVLVLSGNTLPAQHQILIEATGIVPTYVCESVFT
jgi:HAD superfamily hydrolase (TIGR01450 family)